MTICPHCKSENNNFYYCRGCGRKIPFISKQEKRNESSSSDFIEEVIDIIESKFISSDFTMTNIANMGSISLDEISKEEGIILLGNEQWQEIPRRQQCACFFGGMVSIYLMSAIITMIGFIAGANDVKMVFQLYASAFLLLSFTEWFLVPYFSGFSLVSSLLYNCSMFTYRDENMKNKTQNLLMMFLFASIPGIFVVPFLYSLLKSKLSENYIPLALSISEIKYLKKISSGK